MSDGRGSSLPSIPRQRAPRRSTSRDASDSAGQYLTPLPFTHDVAIVGLGYVGLPTALAFQAAGRRVLGIDVNVARLDDIRALRADLLESDRRRLRVSLDADRFDLSVDPARIAEAKAVIICVPTPVTAHLLPDLRILEDACAVVVRAAVPGQVIILTSTTYVGSTQEMLVEPLAARGLQAGINISVAFSPERIDPGNDRHSHEDVPRVVGGATDLCTKEAVAALAGYAEHLHEVSSTGAAEMTKLFENTFRAVNIALANEIAEVCGVLKLDVLEVIEAAATKPYGFMPFYPGPGVGGHCIPCDPHYLLWQLRKARLRTPVIAGAMEGIAERPARVVDRIREVLSDSGRALSGASVLVVGVAYKPDVADVRESPALEIMNGLLATGARVTYHDDLVPTATLPNGSTLSSVIDPAAVDADIVVLHTQHSGCELGWLSDGQMVLDTTYRHAELPQRAVL